MDPTGPVRVVSEPPSTDEMEEEPLYEELTPDFEDVLGAFKTRTRNPPGNRYMAFLSSLIQRAFIHMSSKMSKFRKTIDTVLVVHGWETPAKTVPMTLIIYGVGLTCQARDFRIRSARLWLAFGEDDKANPPNEDLAAPEVVAWAPFVQPNKWGASKETVDEKTTISGTVGIDQVARADANLGREIARSYTREHFDRGSTDRLVKNDKVRGITWYCEQNNLQNYGVEPSFHIAVLVKRSHTTTNKPITFKAIFDMKIEAGFSHDLEQGVRRAFRLWKPEDDPIYYDPARNDQVGGTEGSGMNILKKVKKDSLGELASGEKLSGLVDPAGTLSGLEPLKPKTA